MYFEKPIVTSNPQHPHEPINLVEEPMMRNPGHQ